MAKKSLIKNLLLVLFIEIIFEVGFINVLKILNISYGLYAIVMDKTLFLILLFTLNKKLTKQHIQFSIKLDRHKSNNMIVLIVVLLLIGLTHIDRFLYAFTIGLVACLTEEYLMRGIVLGSLLHIFQDLKNKYARILLPVSISSILFGTEHFINLYSQSFDMTVGQVMMTTAIGFVFSGAFLWTQNLLYPILCHFILDYLVIIVYGISQNSNATINNMIFPSLIYLFVSFIIIFPVFDQRQDIVR